jgi:hypothetical protein
MRCKEQLTSHANPYCYTMAMEVGGMHPIQFLIAVYKEFIATCYRGGDPHSIRLMIASYQEFNAQWYT